MTTNTDTYFESMAREYDERTLRGLPRYEEMLGQIAAHLPDAAETILELGCGTGALTGMLAHRYPSAAIRAIDASAQMIEVAKERLARQGVLVGRVEFGVSLFEDLAMPDKAFDLVAANMSLHHLIDKRPFYAKIRGSLRAGGAFVFGDELIGAMPDIERRHWDAWAEFASQPGHLSQEEIDGIVQHVEQFDHYETLPRQLELLVGPGFGQVDCTWRYLNYAVFVAIP